MTEILHTLDAIEKADKKIDENNQVDEQAIFDKLNQTEDYFRTFENTKLKDLEKKLDPIQFQKLQNEFSRLRFWFETDLSEISKKISILEEWQLEDYNNIIIWLQDRFWWLLEIKKWDNIWNLATKFLQLPEEWKLQSYSWFQLADWLVENEWIKKTWEWASQNLLIKEWDIILIPWEYTILKELMKNNDYFDVKELLSNQNIKYSKEFEWLSSSDKFNIKIIIARYFSYKWDSVKSKNLLLELAGEYEKQSWKEEAEEDWINPFVKEIFKDDPEWLKAYLDMQLKKYDDKWNYEWFFWFFDWISDWFLRWIYEQLWSYASMLEWDAQKKVLEVIELIKKEWFWLIKDILWELWDEIKWIWDIFTNPHKWWVSLWKMFLNLIIWLVSWWVAWASVKIATKLNKILSKWKFLDWLLVLNKWVGLSASTLKWITWISPKLLNPKEFLELWIKDKFKKISHESMFYSWSDIYIVFSELTKIWKLAPYMSIFKYNIKTFITPDNKTLIKINIKNIDNFMWQLSDSGWKLWLWARRLSKPYNEKSVKNYVMSFFKELLFN